MALQDAIRTDNGKLRITLSKALYTKEALSSSIEDFSEHFSGNIANSPSAHQQEAYTIELVPKNRISDALLHTAGMEFCNYALSLMQSG